MRYLAAQLPRKQQRAALDLAEVELGKAIQETDASAETYADLGAVLHRQGEHRRAVIAFSRAITMDRSDPQLLVNRGWSQEALNHLNEALADFTAALAVAPACPEALAGLGFVEARLGDLPSAQRYASLALLHAKNDYLIMHNTACIYAQLAILDPANARVHEDAAISMLSQARDQWRTRVAGPSELELIALESAFGPALRARPEFKALVSQ